MRWGRVWVVIGVIGVGAAVASRWVATRGRANVTVTPRAASVELPPWFGDPAAPPVEIRGAVHGAAGPVTVRLAADLPDPWAWSGREVTSDAAGRFAFGPTRAGRYLVQAYAGALISRVMDVDARAGAVDVDVEVWPCGEVTGEVESWTPVFGSAWVIMPVMRRGVEVSVLGRRVATTDARGRFTLCGPADEFALDLRGGGAAAERWHLGEIDERRSPRTLINRFQGPVSPGRWIGGTVVDEGGRPLAGVGVQPIWHTGVTHVPPQPVPAAATTDAAGQFVVEVGDMRGHSFRLWWRGEVRDVDTRVGTTPGEVPTRPRLVWPTAAPPADRGPRTAIRGRVVRGGAPIADALVEAEFNGESYGRIIATGRSERAGRFAIDLPGPYPGAPNRSLELRASHVGRQLRGRLVVPVGAATTELELPIGVTARAEGVVVDPDGVPIAGVVVATSPNAAHRADATAATGRFTARLEAPGWAYTPWLRLHVYTLPGDGDRREHLPLPGARAPRVDARDPDGVTAGLRLTVARAPAAIAGAVVDTEGRAVAATVHQLPTRGSRTPVPVTADGRFTVDPYTDPPYTFLATTADGRVAVVRGVEMTSPPVALVVRPAGRLLVHCVDLQPQALIEVSAGALSFKVGCGVELDGLPAGRYAVTAEVQRGPFPARVFAAADVVSGRRAEATLRWTTPRAVELIAVDFDSGAPLRDARCRAWLADDGPSIDGALDAGTVGLPRLPVEVACEASSYLAGQAVVAIDDRVARVVVPLVRLRPGAVDLGAEFMTDPRGARVRAVADEAAAAGVQVDDVVTAIDGVALAGRARASIVERALAWPGQVVTWTVRRGPATLRLTLTAPR